MHQVTFFTKPDCSLCRAALFVVQRVQTRVPFSLDLVDISSAGSERWLDIYRNDIPVIHLNGREIFRHRVDERKLFEFLT